MRFNHTCNKNLIFYFLLFKGYNFTSVLPTHTTTNLIYLFKISDIFHAFFLSMIFSLPSLFQTTKVHHGPGHSVTQQSLSILSWEISFHFFWLDECYFPHISNCFTLIYFGFELLMGITKKKKKKVLKSTTHISKNPSSTVVCPRSNFISCQISKYDSLLTKKECCVSAGCK